MDGWSVGWLDGGRLLQREMLPLDLSVEGQTEARWLAQRGIRFISL